MNNTWQKYENTSAMQLLNHTEGKGFRRSWPCCQERKPAIDSTIDANPQRPCQEKHAANSDQLIARLASQVSNRASKKQKHHSEPTLS